MYVSVVFLLFFFFMILRPPRSTRTDTLFPYTTLFRSLAMTAAPAAMAEDVTYLLPAPPSLPAFGPWMVAQQRGYFKAERSEEHTSELQSLMRISYAVFCLKKKT